MATLEGSGRRTAAIADRCPRPILNRSATLPIRRDATRHHRDEETRMTKHIESTVLRLPVRDADRVPARRPAEQLPTVARHIGPLIPVHEIPGLAPEQRTAELRLRVQSGVYGRPSVVDQVARAVVQARD
jgi:hypothetical protein